MVVYDFSTILDEGGPQSGPGTGRDEESEPLSPTVKAAAARNKNTMWSNVLTLSSKSEAEEPLPTSKNLGLGIEEVEGEQLGQVGESIVNTSVLDSSSHSSSNPMKHKSNIGSWFSTSEVLKATVFTLIGAAIATGASKFDGATKLQQSQITTLEDALVSTTPASSSKSSKFGKSGNSPVEVMENQIFQPLSKAISKFDQIFVDFEKNLCSSDRFEEEEFWEFRGFCDASDSDNRRLDLTGPPWRSFFLSEPSYRFENIIWELSLLLWYSSYKYEDFFNEFYDWDNLEDVELRSLPILESTTIPMNPVCDFLRAESASDYTEILYNDFVVYYPENMFNSNIPKCLGQPDWDWFIVQKKMCSWTGRNAYLSKWDEATDEANVGWSRWDEDWYWWFTRRLGRVFREFCELNIPIPTPAPTPPPPPPPCRRLQDSNNTDSNNTDSNNTDSNCTGTDDNTTNDTSGRRLYGLGYEINDESIYAKVQNLLSWFLGIEAMPEGAEEEEELIDVEEADGPFELDDWMRMRECDVPELEQQSDNPAAWNYYDGLIEKNRNIASLARSVKEYAPKRGLVEDTLIDAELQEDEEDDEDVTNKNEAKTFIPRRLLFTHKEDLLNCDVSSTEPSLHTMAHNVRDTIKAYSEVWGDDMEYDFLTDVECRKAVYETEPELLAYYDDLEGMFKGYICRSAYLYLNGGYYLDVDLLVVHPFVASPANKFVTVKWAWYEKDKQFFQAFIVAAPRNEIIKKSLTIMLELLNGTRAKRGGGEMHMIGTQAMQDAWAELAQDDASVASHGKNEEVYLLSEHRIGEYQGSSSYVNLPTQTKGGDAGYTDITCNFVVTDDEEESVYFFSHIIGSELCGKQLLSGTGEH